VCAAKFLEENSKSFLYRNHESPDLLKWEQLRKSLATLGISVDSGGPTSKTVQNLLSQIALHRSGDIYQHLVLKSLQQAMYEPDKKGHFGLALDSYTHFTSPIRRYPDLLVHRAIKSILLGIEQADGAIEDNLTNLGMSCSQTERRAEAAGWAVDAWLKCDYLLDLVGETLDGVVAGVTEFGLFVELDGYFIQGLLHVTNIGNDYYKYYPNRVSLVGESSGQAFSLGDAIRVKIVSVEPAQGKIDLIVESSIQKKKKRKKRFSKQRRRRGSAH
jgi:ribonuclease R